MKRPSVAPGHFCGWGISTSDFYDCLAARLALGFHVSTLTFEPSHTPRPCKVRRVLSGTSQIAMGMRSKAASLLQAFVF